MLVTCELTVYFKCEYMFVSTRKRRERERERERVDVREGGRGRA